MRYSELPYLDDVAKKIWVGEELHRPARCTLDGDSLIFKWGEERFVHDSKGVRFRCGPPSVGRSDRNLYKRFIRLHNAKPEAICEFAKSHGPLRSVSRDEPITDWRLYARLGFHLLHAGTSAELRGSQDDWDALRSWAWDDFPGKITKRSPESWRGALIARTLNKWLAEAGVSWMGVQWTAGALVPQKIGTCLLGVIGLQIVDLLSSHQRNKVPCAGCGRLILPSPKATRGARRFCQRSECRRRAHALAMRDKRQRER